MEQRSNWKAKLKTVSKPLFPVLGAALVLVLLHVTGWSRVGEAFARVGWQGALILVVLGLGESFFDSVALQAAVRTRIRLTRILFCNGAGALLNMLVGEVGEVFKGAILRKNTDTRDAVTATVVWNYVFQVTRPAVAVVAALVGLLLGTADMAGVAVMILLAAVLSLGPYVLFWLAIRKGMAEAIARLVLFVRRDREHADAFRAKARELDRSIREFRRERRAAYNWVHVHQVVARLFSWATLYAACMLVGLDSPFATVSLVYAGFSVASYVILVFPTRLGVTEGAGSLVFSLVGLDAGIGLIVYVLLRLKAVAANSLCLVFKP